MDKTITKWKLQTGGFVTMTGGLIIMHNHCGTPRGANPNDETVVINPPGAYHNGGANENLTPELKSSLDGGREPAKTSRMQNVLNKQKML